MTVYIYSGYGASTVDVSILEFMFSSALSGHGIAVQKIAPEDLNAPNAPWQRDGSVLVFGGGEFSKVKQVLAPYGRQAILDFVAEKSYLGICKGGYAGAAQIEFLGSDGAKSSDGFGFFNGVARGSVPFRDRLYTGQSDSAQIVHLRHEGRGIDFPALYWGGPYFDLTGRDATVNPLVTMQGPAGTALAGRVLAMGLRVPVGPAGRAVLLGYHPEALPDHIRHWVLKFCDNQDDIVRIERDMAAYAPWQFQLGFASVLDDLQVVPGYSFLDKILDYARRAAPVVAAPFPPPPPSPQ